MTAYPIGYPIAYPSLDLIGKAIARTDVRTDEELTNCSDDRFQLANAREKSGQRRGMGMG